MAVTSIDDAAGPQRQRGRKPAGGVGFIKHLPAQPEGDIHQSFRRLNSARRTGEAPSGQARVTQEQIRRPVFLDAILGKNHSVILIKSVMVPGGYDFVTGAAPDFLEFPGPGPTWSHEPLPFRGKPDFLRERFRRQILQRHDQAKAATKPASRTKQTET